jgi:uncharacterized membrane protein
MIQFGGITYRVVRLERHHYAVVRINDDLQVGRFQTSPRLRVFAEHVEAALLGEIARAALRTARTSAVAHPKPEPSQAERAQARRPSSMPPPATALP